MQSSMQIFVQQCQRFYQTKITVSILSKVEIEFNSIIKTLKFGNSTI